MANPTTLVETFNGSLGSFSGSGAVRYSSGLYLEQATTNLILNPIFASSTGTWTLSGSGTNRSYTQTGSLPSALPGWLASTVTTGVICAATAQMTGTFPGANTRNLTLTAAAYMASGYIFIPSSWTGSGITLRATSYTSATGTVATNANMSLRDQWQLVTLGPFTPDSGDLVGDIGWYINVAPGTWNNGESFYTTAIQVELGSYATSICTGSLGTGYSWSGTTDASSSSRTAASASVATASHIDPSTGSLAFRFTRKIDTGGTETILECGTAGSGTDYLSIYVNSSDKLVVSWKSNGAAAQTVTSTGSIAVDTEYLVITKWNGTSVSLSLNVGTPDTGTRDAVQGSWGAGALTLEASAGGAIFNGLLVANRPTKQTEDATLKQRPTWSARTLRDRIAIGAMQLRPIGA